MPSVLVRAVRLWLAHWPALLAWMLGGTLVHFLVLKLAAWVGARSAVGGILLLPVAALALLVAYVAMFLVLRGSMPGLRSVASVPADAGDRRTAFLDGVLGGILPFVAFYAAWGFIREDVISYTNDAFEWQLAWGLRAAVEGLDYDTAGTISDLGFTPLTIGLLVIAFAGRWAYKRFGSRLPRRAGAARLAGIVAVYLEALWVYLAAYLVTDLVALVAGWVQTRQGLVWLADLRGGMTGWLAPLGLVWDVVGLVLSEAGGIVLLPIAWLTIAGVIYGQAVKAAAPRLSGGRAVERLSRVRRTYHVLPARARRRIGDYWESLVVGRFRPIGAAIVLMWRAGPLLIAGYVLLFTLVEFGEQWLLVGASRALGPHEWSFWVPVSLALVSLAAVLVEPVRISVIAATYDATVARLVRSEQDDDSAEPAAGPATDASADDVEAVDRADLVLAQRDGDRHGETVESAGSVGGQQDEGGEVDGLR